MAKKGHLLTSQSNQVLAVVKEAGLPRSDFKWEDRTAHGSRVARVPVLVHAPTKFYFRFEQNAARTRHRAEFSPGHQSRKQEISETDWDGMLKVVRSWVSNVKREIEEPDLWDAVSEETDLMVEEGPHDDAPLTRDEKDRITESLDHISAQMDENQEALGLSVDHLRFITGEIERLKLKSAQSGMTKRDWKILLVGTLVNISWATGLGAEGTKTIFKIVGEAFRWLFEHQLLLP